MRINKLILMAVMTVSFTVSNAWSACDMANAAPGTPADCNSVITLTINGQVIVEGLGDIDLGAYAGNDMSGSDDFCIGTTTPASGVTVTFTSQNAAGGQFNLAGTTITTDLVPYNLQFNDGVTLTNSVTSGTGISTTDIQTLACAADSANIQVDVLAADINTAADTTYTDTITVLVAAN